MLAALDEAKRFRGYCAPNPSVGAVAVRSQEIIARAAHQGAGAAHAEINVLSQLEGDLSDICLYITLEPCNHWGRTPPCVKTIIERKVGKVIYGYSDPNPVVKQNNTPKILSNNGIDVLHYPMPEVNEFYQSYQYWTSYKRPWVTCKMAISLDGRIAKNGGESFQLSNELCREFTHERRNHSDVILTSAATILADNPRLTVRIDEKPIGKPIAIIDTELTVPRNAKSIGAAKKVLQFHQPKANAAKLVTNKHFPVSVNSEGLDLDEVISLIGKEGYHDVWVETGGKLFTSLHQNKLVQTTFLYITPHILGEQAVPAFLNMSNWIKEDPQTTWQVKSDNAILRLDW